MTKQNTIVSLLSFAALGIAALLFLLSAKAPNTAGAANIDQMNGPMTIGSSTVTTASTLVLATSTGRVYAQIGNDSAVDVYLSVGQAAVRGKGIYLKAGTVYTINENNLFSGAVYAVATTTTANITSISKDGYYTNN